MNTDLTFTFLGTGTSQGVPVIGCECEVCKSKDRRDKKLRSSGLFSKNGENLVVDIGPDFRMQMLRNKVLGIKGILLTHEHNDHVIGMDEVRPFNFMSGEPIQVFGEERVLEEVKKRFEYIFTDNPYPGAPRMELKIIEPGMVIQVGAFEVEVIRINHGNLPILGFRIEDIAYCTDVKEIPEISLNKLKDLDHLILSALHHNRHHSHLNLAEALTLADKIESKNTWLTHSSHRMGKYLDMEKTLPPKIHLAYDGLNISSIK